MALVAAVAALPKPEFKEGGAHGHQNHHGSDKDNESDGSEQQKESDVNDLSDEKKCTLERRPAATNDLCFNEPECEQVCKTETRQTCRDVQDQQCQDRVLQTCTQVLDNVCRWVNVYRVVQNWCSIKRAKKEKISQEKTYDVAQSHQELHGGQG